MLSLLVRRRGNNLLVWFEINLTRAVKILVNFYSGRLGRRRTDSLLLGPPIGSLGLNQSGYPPGDSAHGLI